MDVTGIDSRVSGMSAGGRNAVEKEKREGEGLQGQHVIRGYNMSN